MMKTIRITILLLAVAIIGLQAQKAEELFGLSDFYDVQPDVANCKPGTLKDSEKQAILKELNYIRSIHGLKPVEYRSSLDGNTSKAALMLAANDNKIGNPDNPHNPPGSWSCFSSDGADGCQNSNLAYRWYSGAEPSSLTSLNMWMIDNNVPECGHRRWLIDPFLKFISFGRADGNSKRLAGMKVTTMTIYVISNEKQSLSGWDSNFVAYPYHEYPKSYFYESGKGWFLSFTAIFDKSNHWANQNVNFSGATIEMKDASGNTVAITNKAYQNDGYGVPNLLKWNVPTLKNDVKYTVTIKNVTYSSQKKDFTYWFKLVDQPSGGGEAPAAAPLLASPANNATNQDANPTLSWNAVADAAFYDLQVSTSSDFTSGTMDYKNITLLLFKPDLAENTKYFWRVAAGNQYGVGPWSQTRNLTTKKMPYYAPIVLSPSDGAFNINEKTVFSWEKVTGANSYTLQISSTDDFTAPKVEQKNISDTVFSFKAGALDPTSMYYWKVRAVGMSGASSWSQLRTFWTSDPTSVDDLSPAEFRFSLFPNPATDYMNLNIQVSKAGRYSAEIYNLLGEKVLELPSEYLTTGSYSAPVSISGLNAGIYYLRLSTSEIGAGKWFTVSGK